MRRAVLRFAAPALFLVAATVAVVLVRTALSHGSAPHATPPAKTKAVAVVRHIGPARKAKHYYTIKAGDTLGAIADRLGLSVDRLQTLNPGVLPTSLRIGQRIRTR
jgi:LysM repeat protein